MKERIALISANIGSFDPVFDVVKQSIDCDVFYYTERNLPHPLPNLNNRLRGKYLKIMTHRFLPNYDIFVWVDGSVEITDPKFVQRLVEKVRHDQISMCVHPERKNAYDELDYILTSIDNGKEYLVARYANEPLAEEMLFYKNNHLPEDYPLYVCRFFARRNVPLVNACFEDWWNGVLEYSNFDQTMFSYMSWKHGLSIAPLDYKGIVENLIKVHKHK